MTTALLRAPLRIQRPERSVITYSSTSGMIGKWVGRRTVRLLDTLTGDHGKDALENIIHGEPVEGHTAFEERPITYSLQYNPRKKRSGTVYVTVNDDVPDQSFDLSAIAGCIGHDLRNLMMVVSGNVELAKDLIDNEIVLGSLEDVLAAVNSATEMSALLMEYSRPQRVTASNFSNSYIPHILEGVSTMSEQVIRTRQLPIEIATNHGYVGEAFVDHLGLNRALLNLGLNAIDALAGKGVEGRILYGSELVASPYGPMLRLSVADTVPGGIPEAIQSKIFDPFFTDGKKGGTGLGLATVRGTAKAHDGVADYTTGQEGTTFYLEFPLVKK